MKTYIILLSFTDQGMSKIKDSPDRADTFSSKAEKVGIKVKDIYWTIGQYDGVLIFEAPDETVAASAVVSLCLDDCVKSQTLLAFDRKGFGAVLAAAS